MTVFGDFVAVLAEQHVDDVAGAEPLPGSNDARQQLLRGDRCVPRDRRAQADVAVAALGGGVLPEVLEQRAAPALRHFAPAEQRIELVAFVPLEAVVAVGLVDHASHPHHVLQSVHHPRFGRFAVTARATGLLVIRFDALRQIEVRDVSHVGFVDAHAERDGRHDHHAVFPQKAILIRRAHLGGESGVIRQRIEALVAQPRGDRIDAAPRQAIHDAGFVATRRQELEQLCARVGFHRDAVADVRPIETADEANRIGQLEAHHDLVARARVRGRGQCHPRHAGEVLLQHVEPEVVLAEVVAPLRHAVRFVDRDQRNR